MTTLPDYIPKGTDEEIREELKKWVGHKVVRGPTWEWNNQDEDSEFGIVNDITQKTEKEYQIVVKWKKGPIYYYRVGNNYADVILLHPEEIYGRTTDNLSEYPNAFYKSMDILPGDQINLKDGREFEAIIPKEAKGHGWSGDSNRLIYLKNGYEYYATQKNEIKMILKITPRKNIRQKPKKEKKEKYKLVIELPEKFYIT